MDTANSRKSSSDDRGGYVDRNPASTGISISTVSSINGELSPTDPRIMEWTGIKAVTIPYVHGRRLSHRPLTRPPNSCLILSIIVVFLALPLGVIAVYFSIQSLKASIDGDYWRARQNARNAISFAVAGLTVGVFIIILLVILYTSDSL